MRIFALAGSQMDCDDLADGVWRSLWLGKEAQSR